MVLMLLNSYTDPIMSPAIAPYISAPLFLNALSQRETAPAEISSLLYQAYHRDRIKGSPGRGLPSAGSCCAVRPDQLIHFSNSTRLTPGIPLNTVGTTSISRYPRLLYMARAGRFRAFVSIRSSLHPVSAA